MPKTNPLLTMTGLPPFQKIKPEHIEPALDELIKGRTTFIITHRLPIIRNADLILVLEDGQVVERGRHSELMARNGLYQQIYESQLSVTEGSGENFRVQDNSNL